MDYEMSGRDSLAELLDETPRKPPPGNFSQNFDDEASTPPQIQRQHQTFQDRQQQQQHQGVVVALPPQSDAAALLYQNEPPRRTQQQQQYQPSSYQAQQHQLPPEQQLQLQQGSQQDFSTTSFQGLSQVYMTTPELLTSDASPTDCWVNPAPLHQQHPQQQPLQVMHHLPSGLPTHQQLQQKPPVVSYPSAQSSSQHHHQPAQQQRQQTHRSGSAAPPPPPQASSRSRQPTPQPTPQQPSSSSNNNHNARDEALIEKLGEKLRQSQSDLRETQAKNRQLEERLQQLENNLGSTQMRCKNLESDCASWRNTAQQSQDRTRELEQQCDRLRRGAAQFRDHDIPKLQAELQSAITARDQWKNDCQEAAQLNECLHERLHQLQLSNEEIPNLKMELSRVKEQHRRLSEVCEEDRAAARTLETKLEHSEKHCRDLGVKLSQEMGKVEDLSDQIEETHTTRLELENLVQKWKSEYKSLDERNNENEIVITDYKSMLEESNLMQSRLEQRLKETEEKLLEAQRLGDAAVLELQAQLENLTDASHLQNKQLAAINSDIAEKILLLESTTRTAEEALARCADLELDLAEKTDDNQTLQRLVDELRVALDTKTESHQSLEEEMDRTNRELLASTENTKTLTEALKMKDQELIEATHALTRLDAKMQELINSNVAAQKERDEAVSQAKESLALVDAREQELDVLQRSMRAKEVDFEHTRQEIQADREKAKASLMALQLDGNNELLALRQQLENAKVEISQLCKDRDGALQRVQDYEIESEGLIASLREQIATFQRLCAEREHSINEATKELVEQRHKFTALEELKDRIASHLADRDNHVKDLQHELRGVNAALQEAQTDSTQVEEMKRELKQKIDELRGLEELALRRDVEVERSKQALDSLEFTFDKQSQELNDKTRALNQLEALYQESARTIETIELQKDRLETRLARLEAESNHTKRQDAETIKSLRDRVSSMEDTNAKLDSACSQLEKSLAHEQSKLRDATELCQRTQTELVGESKKRSLLKDKIEAWRIRYNEQKTVIHELEQERDKALDERNDVATRHNALYEQHRNLKKQLADSVAEAEGRASVSAVNFIRQEKDSLNQTLISMRETMRRQQTIWERHQKETKTRCEELRELQAANRVLRQTIERHECPSGIISPTTNGTNDATAATTQVKTEDSEADTKTVLAHQQQPSPHTMVVFRQRDVNIVEGPIRTPKRLRSSSNGPTSTAGGAQQKCNEDSSCNNSVSSTPTKKAAKIHQGQIVMERATY